MIYQMEHTIEGRKMKTSDAIRMAEANPGVKHIFRKCELFSDAPSLGGPDNLFFENCTFVGRTDKPKVEMKSEWSCSTDLIKDRTTPAYMEGEMCRKIAQDMHERSMKRAEEEMTFGDVTRIQKAMRANRDKVSEQMYEYYQRLAIQDDPNIQHCKPVAQSKLSDSMADALAYGARGYQALPIDPIIGQAAQRRYDMELRRFRERIVSGLGIPEDVIRPLLGTPQKKEPEYNLDSIQKTEKRGFPVWEGVPEAQKRSLVPNSSTADSLPPSERLTESDIRMDMREKTWQKMGMSVLEHKKEIVQQMLKEIEEEEKEKPKVGSPFSLSDWCQQPLTTALHKESK